MEISHVICSRCSLIAPNGCQQSLQARVDKRKIKIEISTHL
jgi:hypothetical protein